IDMESLHSNSSWYEDNYTDQDNASQRIFLLYLLLFVAGLTLNALVVWVNWRLVSNCNGVLFCVLNVSVSDLLIIVTHNAVIDVITCWITPMLLEWDKLGCYIYQHNFVDWYAAHTFLYLIFQFLGPAAIIMTFNMQTLQAVWTSPEGLVQGKKQGELWLVHLYSLLFVLCWLPFHIVLPLRELRQRRGKGRTAANEKAKQLSDACTSQSDGPPVA
uniref:G-protein coupled receptors family 1 profile domain-containing protein n=1 Tax=Oncorhynchus kisutch TaxID=8019 RepID=A0A8C7IJ68_ONCKI